jgi:phosphoribosylglycinamide formyltransferase 2
MNREGIRNFANLELGIKTSKYLFATNLEEFQSSIKQIGIPCVAKPIMSSSGKGQSLIRSEAEIQKAWDYGQSGGRSGKGKMIVEEFVPFDFEITLLTIRHKDGTSFLPPIGHKQINGDYVESWMPQVMSPKALEEAQTISEKITTGLGGYGIFGVELFIKGDDVYFSEVSPRPHDTGLVTLISQNFSEFSLHVRALLGLPLPTLHFYLPAASAAILLEGNTNNPIYLGLDSALKEIDSDIRLFGKPNIEGKRRMGVALGRGSSVEEARKKANLIRDQIQLTN